MSMFEITFKGDADHALKDLEDSLNAIQPRVDAHDGRKYISSLDVYETLGLPYPKSEYRWYLEEPKSDYTIEEMEECNKCFEEKFEYLLEDPATGSLLDIYSHLMCVAGANDTGVIGSEHDSIAGNLTVAKFKLSQRIADEVYLVPEE